VKVLKYTIISHLVKSIIKRWNCACN